MTAATAFSEREHLICTVARLVEDGKNYWVAGGGSPLYAVLLGRKLYAASAQYITEDGVIAPEAALPFEPIMTMMASRPGYRALAWGTMNLAGQLAQLGLMDYGILNSLQIDQHGNINSTILGEYPDAGRRFGGPGGADTIAALCWRTVIMTDQQRRKFVDTVDFISSAGFLDGTAGARERAGMPPGTGPWRVVTPWAMYDYEERELRLIAVSPWVTVAEVLAECGTAIRLAPNLTPLAPPTDEELAILRSELDVGGQTIDAAGRWIELRDGRYVFADAAT